MSDTKELTWDDAARSESVSDGASSDISCDESADDNESGSNDSWNAYRNWLSRAPAPARQPRQGLDPAVYTWKGYRNWSDQVKRSWVDRKEQD